MNEKNHNVTKQSNAQKTSKKNFKSNVEYMLCIITTLMCKWFNDKQINETLSSLVKIAGHFWHPFWPTWKHGI